MLAYFGKAKVSFLLMTFHCNGNPLTVTGRLCSCVAAIAVSNAMPKLNVCCLEIVTVFLIYFYCIHSGQNSLCISGSAGLEEMSHICWEWLHFFFRFFVLFLSLFLLFLHTLSFSLSHSLSHFLSHSIIHD